MKILLKILFSITLIFVSVNAQNSEFLKEYTYNASDDDSKNSSRKKAIAQIKSLVSEEVGTMIKSSLTMHTKQENDKLDELVNSKIHSMSQSFIQLSILEERWDGRQYYIKAKVKVDKAEAKNIVEEFKKSEENSDTSKKTFVQMQREQPMFLAGKMAFKAQKDDLYVVVAEIDCLKGGGRCWIMKNVDTEEKGVARVVVLKNFHNVYEK